MDARLLSAHENDLVTSVCRAHPHVARETPTVISAVIQKFLNVFETSISMHQFRGACAETELSFRLLSERYPYGTITEKHGIFRGQDVHIVMLSDIADICGTTIREILSIVGHSDQGVVSCAHGTDARSSPGTPLQLEGL